MSHRRRLFQLGIGGPGPKRGVDWEIEHHLTEQTDRLVEEGWEEEDARREAERRFGDLRYHRSKLCRTERRKMRRDQWKGMASMVGQDLRLALRTLRTAPAYSVGIILTLALGIGASATMFGILDRLLLTPPEHVVDADQLHRVYLRRVMPTGRIYTSQLLSYPDFSDLKTVGGLTMVAAYTPGEIILGSGVEAERVSGVLASWEFFPLLGVSPTIGRFYAVDEDRIGAPMTAVLDYGFWQRRFGGDPSILGRTLSIGGAPVTVIGVAPKGFTGVDLEPVDIWLPLHPVETHLSGHGEWQTMGRQDWLWTVVRTDPNASVESVEEEATALHLRRRREGIAASWYDDYEARVFLGSLIAARGPRVAEEAWMRFRGVTEAKVARWLAGVSFLVLLIACANVAGLLLARATDRSREVAVRLAIGVSRARLVGQMTTEVVVLALLGGLTALILAQWGGTGIRRALLPDVHWASAGVGGRVLVFTLIVALMAGLLAGLLPALRASSLSVAGVLGGSGSAGAPRRSRIRAGLSVFQAALSVLLLVGAGLFVKSLSEVWENNLGIDVDRVALVRLEFEESEVGGVEATRRYRQVASRLFHVPGIVSATVTSAPIRMNIRRSLSIPGLDSIPTLPGGGPYVQRVGQDYFSTLGIDVLRGRALTSQDQALSASVAVVSETMARTLWPGESPLGKCVKHGGEDAACSTVVGVVEDASKGRIEEPAFMQYYLPLDPSDQIDHVRGGYVRFTAGFPGSVSHLRREALEATDGIRYAHISLLREILGPQARSWTLGATMFSVFGVLALLVASVGLYSALAYNVARRRRELGIRAAVGATRESVVGLVVRDGVYMAGAGLILGIALTLLASFWVEALLFNTSPRDPEVYSGVALTVLLVSVAASAVPAWKASRVDPVEALKTE